MHRYNMLQLVKFNDRYEGICAGFIVAIDFDREEYHLEGFRNRRRYVAKKADVLADGEYLRYLAQHTPNKSLQKDTGPAWQWGQDATL